MITRFQFLLAAVVMTIAAGFVTTNPVACYARDTADSCDNRPPPPPPPPPAVAAVRG